jgi:di/tricarboxylate transporter
MPLALLICTSLNLNPTGVMGIIYIGATSSILTPMATPGIPLTMGAAGYSFKDIVKMGLVPALLEIIVGIVWCSLIFPAV